MRGYRSAYDSLNMTDSCNSVRNSDRSYEMSVKPSQVSPDKIPDFIDVQMNAIKKLNQNAARARRTQEQAEYSAQHALREAESARQRAKEAADLSAGFGKKKAAIEALQQTVVSMSDALNETTQAQEDALEAQIQLSEVQQSIIEYQEKVTEVSQFLLQMGALSIAQNRAVVRELELRLKGASEEEIGDLAQQELKAVFMQLKQQLDLIERIDRLEEKNNVLRSKLDEIAMKTTELSAVSNRESTIQSLVQRVYKLETLQNKTFQTPVAFSAKVSSPPSVPQAPPPPPKYEPKRISQSTVKNHSNVALACAALALIISILNFIMQL